MTLFSVTIFRWHLNSRIIQELNSAMKFFQSANNFEKDFLQNLYEISETCFSHAIGLMNDTKLL